MNPLEGMYLGYLRVGLWIRSPNQHYVSLVFVSPQVCMCGPGPMNRIMAGLGLSTGADGE